MGKTQFIGWLPVLFSALLMGAEGGGVVSEKEERRGLEEQRRELVKKIETLNREQETLLFRKALSESDSKHLFLDFGAQKGTLKYRNRTLRTFEFERTRGSRFAPRSGEYALTAKTDGAPSKRTLAFGDELVFYTKKSLPSRTGVVPGKKRITRLIISRKDMAALYYAVEHGSRLYVIKQ